MRAIAFQGISAPTRSNKDDVYTNRLTQRFSGLQPTSEPSDVFQHVARPSSNIAYFGQQGRVTRLITFGALNNPYALSKPGIQMRVRGVTNHQRSSNPNPKYPPKDTNINKLAESAWKDGEKLQFKIRRMRGRKQAIDLIAPGKGPIGWVHPEIARHILPLLRKHPNQFQFELSNIIAGMTKGAETIGLRANLRYIGSDTNIEQDARQRFQRALNDHKCRNKIMHYQPETTPEQVLKLILHNEEAVHGAQAAKDMETVVDNITDQLNDPKNKKILLLGHCKPDGDTIGCTVGLKHAILTADPTRDVDVAIDDKIPGLFRNKLPGINEIKRPPNPQRIKEIQQELKELRKKPKSDKFAQTQIKLLEEEQKDLGDPGKLLKDKKKYDLVILMDIPTPKRFTDKFKPYLNDAGSIIYMDHHPFRFNEWQQAAPHTGLDMQTVVNNGLAWVADTVPACTEMVSVIANQLDGFKQNSAKPENASHLDKFVSNIVTGMSTDTGSFTRTANLTPEDSQKPVEQRPNFYPEGHAKWLMNLPGTSIDKKWLRENIVYDLPDKTLGGTFQQAARQIMLEHAVNGRIVHPDISLGIIQVNYDQMEEVWQAAREPEPETTLLDIQNAFKYSEVLGTLRSDPAMHGRNSSKGGGTSLEDRAKENYQGQYDDDRIAVLICQDKKKGQLDEKMHIATQNGLRLSLRSQEGTDYAAMLGNLFGGGGHGAAAGGRIDLPGIDLNTKLAIKINGKIERNPSTILKVLEGNYAILKGKSKKNPVPMDVVKDGQGQTCAELLAAVVTEIRNQKTGQSGSQQQAA